MSDETIPEAAPASDPAARRARRPGAGAGSPAPAPTPAAPATAAPTSAHGDADAATARPRRRRGPRRRARPAASRAGAPSGAAGAARAAAATGDDGAADRAGADGDRARRRPTTDRRPTTTPTVVLADDYTDAAADRGLTTDDVADVALRGGRARAAPLAPDRRPPCRAPRAPRSATRRPRSATAGPRPRRLRRGDGTAAAGSNGAPASAATKRRRRRWRPRPRTRRRRWRQRGRQPPVAPRGGGGGDRRPQRAASTTSSAPTSASATRPLADLDDDVARAPPRPHPQGSPHRSLPHVRARRSRAATPTSRCSRAAAWSSTTLATPDRQRVDRRQHLPRPGAERAARAWRPRSSTSARPKNGVLYRGDVAFDKADVEGGSKPEDRAHAQERAVGPRAGHQEPDRATRAPASPRR